MTGVGIAVALVSLFSAVTVQGQMMQHQEIPPQGVSHQGIMKHIMFSANVMSMVSDVRITGVAITEDNDISVSLTYNGSGSAPSVTVIALTNPMQMMGGSSMGSMGGMMMGSNMMGSSTPMWNHPDVPTWNATQWQHWHSQMTTQLGGSYGQSASLQSQSGSALLESEWASESNPGSIRIDGNTSPYEASDIHVVVFPHLT